MNLLMWILQGLLAVVFLMAGLWKVSTPHDKLKEKMGWTGDFSAGTLKFIGLSELAGAVGLILPALLNIVPVLSVAAAFALALVMVLAIVTHLRRKEQKEMMTNLVLMVLSIAAGILQLV